MANTTRSTNSNKKSILANISRSTYSPFLPGLLLADFCISLNRVGGTLVAAHHHHKALSNKIKYSQKFFATSCETQAKARSCRKHQMLRDIYEDEHRQIHLCTYLSSSPVCFYVVVHSRINTNRISRGVLLAYSV